MHKPNWFWPASVCRSATTLSAFAEAFGALANPLDEFSRLATTTGSAGAIDYDNDQPLAELEDIDAVFVLGALTFGIYAELEFVIAVSSRRWTIEEDPLSGHIFMFINRRKKVKCLW